MKETIMHAALVAVCLLLDAANPKVVPAQPEKNDVASILGRADFWEKAGARNGRKWTDDERKELENLRKTSKDFSIRLRANKVLTDLAGQSRFSDEDAALVAASFRYLEQRLDQPPARTLCIEQGITHYTAGMRADGSGLFLIEHVEGQGFNGGLNLVWNGGTQAIESMQAWGAVPAK
jgi:hypothetical protein